MTRASRGAMRACGASSRRSGSSPAVEARVVITSAPGEEAQVDYGEGPMVRDADSGKYRRTRLFVLTLGYSRKAVRLLVQRSSAQVWAELHERAFRRLGGTVRVVVLDNLKEGVLTPDIYDPTLNPLYRDVLAHYGVVALPCRVGDPRSQGQGRSRRRPRPEDAAARPSLRAARRRSGVSRPLGAALGRYPHPRHDQAPGRRLRLPRSRGQVKAFGSRHGVYININSCGRCGSRAQRGIQRTCGRP